MDRNGDDWTGDQVMAEAAGEAAGTGGSGNRADNRSPTEDGAPRARSVETSASEGVAMNDDGAAPVTTGGSGATGESD
jgi:hypothetical protein